MNRVMMKKTIYPSPLVRFRMVSNAINEIEIKSQASHSVRYKLDVLK